MGVSIKTVTVDVEGLPADTNIYVQSFELKLEVNAVPGIVMNILPIDKPKQGKGEFVTSSAYNVVEITNLYRKLMGYITSGADIKATIKISIEQSDSQKSYTDDGSNQIELKDWILDDVGLSTVNSTDAPILAVTFCHRAIKLTKSGMIYEEVSNEQALPELYKNKVKATSIIPFMDELYSQYANGSNIKFNEIATPEWGGSKKEYGRKAKSFRTKLLKEDPPGKYIKDMTEKLFLVHVKKNVNDALKVEAGRLASPRAFCNSTWVRLIQEICPYFLTTIVPTYDKDMLQLEPNSPWQDGFFALTGEHIESVDMAPKDPSPIIGVAIDKSLWDATPCYNSSIRKSKLSANQMKNTYDFYFPKKVLTNDNIKGDVLNLGEAPLIQNVMSVDLAVNANIHRSGAKGKDLESSGNSITGKDRVELDEAFMKAMFLINYRSKCKASVVMPIRFRDSMGRIMYPGRVMTIMVEETDDGINYNTSYIVQGYVTIIKISGGTDGNCSTYIEMTHARPPYTSGNSDSDILVGAEPNPCYPEVPRESM